MIGLFLSSLTTHSVSTAVYHAVRIGSHASRCGRISFDFPRLRIRFASGTAAPMRS
jgi:hypothetical protein